MSERTFISYAREDQDFVLDLATRLKQRTVPIWLDQWDIPPGADWDQSIEAALHQCSRFIIVLSPAAVASKQVVSFCPPIATADIIKIPARPICAT
jgi:hypothetical protein